MLPDGYDRDGPVSDGKQAHRILTMNARAQEILRQDESRIELHSIGEMIQFLGKTLQWSATGTATEGPQTQIHYRDPAGEEFTMTIEITSSCRSALPNGRDPMRRRRSTASRGCSVWVDSLFIPTYLVKFSSQMKKPATKT